MRQKVKITIELDMDPKVLLALTDKLKEKPEGIVTKELFTPEFRFWVKQIGFIRQECTTEIVLGSY